MSQVVKLLRDLIALPSVNNAFLPPGDPHAGEELVADYLKNRARKAGLEIETQATNSGRDNLIVRLKPLGQATHRIILAPTWTPWAETSTRFSAQQKRVNAFMAAEPAIPRAASP